MLSNPKIISGIRSSQKWTFLLLGLLFFLLSKPTFPQPNCDITIDTDIPVCRYVDFMLSVPFQDNCTYEWKQDDIVVGKDSSLLISILDQTLFTVKVKDTIANDSCISDAYLVTTRPEIYIEFDQLQLTCTNGDNENGNTAKVHAIATGEFEPDEYHYFWDVKPIQIAPGDSSVAQGLKAHLYYSITVTDRYGCFEKDTVWTKAYYNAEVELFANPDDTAFVQKPYIEFSFENKSADTIPLSNFFWDFNDDNDPENSFLPNPTHKFTLDDSEIEDGGKDFLVMFTGVNPQGCDTIYTIPVHIKPAKLLIPNVFTPNGDGINDLFVITEKKQSAGESGDRDQSPDLVDGNYVPNHYYENTKLVVFNRQGRVIFKDDDYQNDWDGDNLPEGVYYYVLKASGPRGEEVYKGAVSIIRGRNH